MRSRITLYADEGKILTNGKTYANSTTLPLNANADDYYEITLDEYKAIQEAERQKALEDIGV